MRCLRCPDVDLVPRAGALGEDVCPSCSGRFLDAPTLEHLAARVLKVDPALLVELAAARGKARCPACDAATAPTTLRGTALFLCGGCGGAFLDGGALRAMAHGSIDEVDAAAGATPRVAGTAAVHASRGGGWSRVALAVVVVASIAGFARLADARSVPAVDVVCPPGARVVVQGPRRAPAVVACIDENGAAHGPYASSWPSGGPRVQGRYVHGLAHGDFTRFHRDGRVRERGAYVDGLRDGDWLFVDDYGMDRLSGRFVRGVPTGAFTMVDDGVGSYGALPPYFFVDDDDQP